MPCPNAVYHELRLAMSDPFDLDDEPQMSDLDLYIEGDKSIGEIIPAGQMQRAADEVFSELLSVARQPGESDAEFYQRAYLAARSSAEAWLGG